MIAKTIIAVQPSLQHAYRSSQPDDLENSMCFQILGFDVILDHKLRPKVLEVNMLSSYGTDSPLDKKIKYDLMRDTFVLLNLSTKRRKQFKKEKSESFNKRVMGEKGPNKFEKDLLRRQKQLDRDAFDLAHLGGYKLVYPVQGDPVKAKKFDAYLETARGLWAEFTGGSKTITASSSNQPPPPLANKQSSTNLQGKPNATRTEQPGVKAKASDLKKQPDLFVKRNGPSMGQNLSGELRKGEAMQMRNTNSEFNKTDTTLHSHHLSSNAQDMSQYEEQKGMQVAMSPYKH